MKFKFNGAAKGFIRGAELCTPLAGVRVLRQNSKGKVCEESSSNERGEWCLKSCGNSDRISFHHEGYVPKTFVFPHLPGIVRLLENKLIGYQKRLWFIPGETVEAYVHAPVRFSARLFRHGLVKEVVLNLGPHDPEIQCIPDGYFVETGLGWRPVFAYKIPGGAQPGIYSLLLEADGQEPFAVPMVVSTGKEQYGQDSRLLVLASTNTWQSYNIWGGRSRYRNFETGNSRDFVDLKSPGFKMNARISKLVPLNVKAMVRHFLREWIKTESFCYKKLTILRPFTNCGLEEDNVFQPFTNHLGGGEWRLLAWLEREKIAYDIVSGAELHMQPDLLKNYKAVILSTHSEYWTREMYEGLKYYHENNNLWILNISGNTMYREIVFFADGSTRCISLSFAHSCADETQILGVRFTKGDLGTCAPYKILMTDHWAFNEIGVKKERTTFGDVSLNRHTAKKYTRYDPGRPGDMDGLRGIGASGWETDKIRKTTPKDIKVVAKGLNKKGGADLVIREPCGTRGGLVSASSITFGGCLLIDDVASMLVKNVIFKALGNESHVQGKLTAAPLL
jgi:N,N-dimethylformamidase